MSDRGDILQRNPENIDELRAAIMSEKSKKDKKKAKKRKLAADADATLGAVSRGDGELELSLGTRIYCAVTATCNKDELAAIARRMKVDVDQVTKAKGEKEQSQVPDSCVSGIECLFDQGLGKLVQEGGN